MTPDKKRLLLIVAGFVVIIILLTQLSPPPRHGKRKAKQAPANQEVASSTAATTTATTVGPKAPAKTSPGAIGKLAAPGTLTGALKSSSFKPLSLSSLSGPPHKDIFVHIAAKPTSVNKKRKPAANQSGSKPAGSASSTATAPPPPSLKLLGTVVAPLSAAAVLEVGQEHLYVEPGDTIPYGKDTLVVSTILPEQVQCVTSMGTKLLQIAKM